MNNFEDGNDRNGMMVSSRKYKAVALAMNNQIFCFELAARQLEIKPEKKNWVERGTQSQHNYGAPV